MKKRNLWMVGMAFVAVIALITAIILTRDNSPVFPNPPTGETPPDSATPSATPSMYDDYAGKKIIVWLMDELALSNMTDTKMKAFNDALIEKGADFILKWVSLPSFGNYDTELKAYIESGEQVDIFYTGSLFALGAPGGMEDSYMQAYQNDWLLPLDDILPDAIKKVFDDTYLDTVRIGGKVYGFSSDPVYGRVSTLYAKDGYNPAGTINTLSALIPMIENAAEPYPLELPRNLSSVCSFLGYTLLESVFAMDESGRIFNIFEDPAFVEYIKTAHEFVQCGYVNPDTTAPYLSAPVVVYGSTAPGVFPDKDYNQYIIGHHHAETADVAISIAKIAKYPDEALTLYSWLLTDKTLADLLVFGVPGFDYTLVDADVSGELNPFLRWYTGLYAFTTPVSSDTDNRDETLRAYNQSMNTTATTGFHFDNRGWEETVFALQTIIQDCVNPIVSEITGERATHGILTGHDPEWESNLSALTAALNEAGIENLLAEAQKQYDEWCKIK